MVGEVVGGKGAKMGAGEIRVGSGSFVQTVASIWCVCVGRGVIKRGVAEKTVEGGGVGGSGGGSGRLSDGKGDCKRLSLR